ncbi:MAG: VIT domain-containing protein [Nannocystaceae bacterium]
MVVAPRSRVGPRRRRAVRTAAALGLVLAAADVACRADGPRRPGGEAEALALEVVDLPGLDPGTASFALTASDGAGLRLAHLEARAVVLGPLALTQLRLGFENPNERPLEGRFDVTLPEGASLSRFAMEIDGAWVEGEIVERERARVVYESYLHRRVDPALLEHDAGNRFRARVFPIAAQARKELIVSYTQELADPREPYRIPLRGLPHLDALDVRVLVADPREGSGAPPRALSFARADFVPAGDLVLRGAAGPDAVGVRHGALAVARVPLTPIQRPEAAPEPVRQWTLLVDTSASQAPGFAARVRGLKPLIAALAARAGRDVDLEVIAFDQRPTRIYAGPSSGFGDRTIDALLARGALGASDLEAALVEARSRARRGGRVLLVSDGIATLGATERGALTAAADALRAAGIARIDALAGGDNDDRSILRAITTPARADAPAGDVASEARTVDERVDRLLTPPLGDVEVVVPGSQWAWPRTLEDPQAGDSALVYAELDEGAPMRVQFRGGSLAERPVPLATAPGPLVQRAWRGAQLRELVERYQALDEGDDRRAPLQRGIVDLSIAYRVLSPFTAMLVLETDDDYRRFDLARRGLSDVLVVGDAGVEVLHRDLKGALERARAAPPSRRATTGPTVAADPTAPTPTTDTDLDGIPDALDGCPNLPEDFDGDQDGDGCPDVLLLDDCQIKLSERVYFERRSAKLSERSLAALAEVRDVLEAAPSIALWVDGHADSEEVGSNKRSKELSQRRVAAVIDHLVKLGVPTARLIPRGFGEEVPIANNRDPEGRAENRRVEFNLVECRRRNRHKGWIASRMAGQPALTGRFRDVDVAIARSPAAGLGIAATWWSEEPGDVLAAIALGEGQAAVGDRDAAARAFASLLDLAPSRAEFRRHVGQRLEAIGDLEWAVDAYRRAVELRPDHPSSHRLLALALARLGRLPEAFAAAEVGLTREYPPGRFPRIRWILGEDLSILGAAWIRSDPAAAPEVQRRLAAHGVTVADAPSLRFVLTWETDASDVDLRVLTAKEDPLDSVWREGDLRRIDYTSGYGPELYAFGEATRDYPYTVNVHFVARGAMGHAMGAVQVLEHDGHGRLGFATLPFVLMQEGSNLDIGAVTGTLIAGEGSGDASAEASPPPSPPSPPPSPPAR